MSTKDIIGVIIVSTISAILLIVSILLLLGKGSFLIAGYNTSDNKAEHDEKKLCKFIGTILMPIALLLPSVAIGNIYGIRWLPIAYEVLVACLVIFSLIYANTGNRFKA